MQVVDALFFVSQIDFHPLSPGHLREGEVRVHNWSCIHHCCFVPSKQDDSSREVELLNAVVGSFTGLVAVVGLLSAAHLRIGWV